MLFYKCIFYKTCAYFIIYLTMFAMVIRDWCQWNAVLQIGSYKTCAYFIIYLTMATVKNQLYKNGDDHELDFMLALKKFRMSHPKNIIAGHLDINSIRNKFMEISELMSKNFLDIMCLSETKIDGSFPIAQFSLPGFKCHRADRNEHGGGIMAYVRNDLPHRRRSDLEHSTHLPVESLIF